MKSTRIFGVVAALAAVLVSTFGAVGPASAEGEQEQTLHFTSEVPTDAVVFYRYGYAVTAESSSGLPVVLTADPNTPACTVSPFPPFIYGNVSAWHGGPCTVFADQPGNDEYAPAEQISMTFEIAREVTSLTARKASKGALGLSPTTFRAALERNGWFGPGYGVQPFVGAPVTFSVGGKQMCTATTVHVDDGTFFGSAVATCKATIGLPAALKYKSYTASYAGSQDYEPSTATGVLQ